MPDQATNEKLIQEAYERSLDKMRLSNSSYGFRAAPNGGVNYNSVWARDGIITTLAAFEGGDEQLIEYGIQTLMSLAEHQASNGQIPSYLRLEKDKIVEVVHGGLGNITSIDSNLWFIIACQTAVEKLDRTEFLQEHFRDVYRHTMRHLASLDADNSGLIEIPVAGDWSDLLGRSYHILYDQVLWWRLHWGAYRMDNWCESEEQRDVHREAAESVRKQLNCCFWWDDEGKKAATQEYQIGTSLPDEDFAYYQSYLQPFHNVWYFRFDAFANILAALSGITPTQRVKAIYDQVISRRLNRPFPLSVLDPVVGPDDEDWLEMYRTKQPAYEYHNGGSWPLAGGFWVSLLAKMGRREEALQELTSLATALKQGDPAWGFYEFLHGQTGEPGGRRDQTWSAASFILAYHAVHDQRFGCFEDSNQATE